MLQTAFGLDCPVAIRYPRGAGAGVPLDTELQSLPLGKAQVLKDGTDAAVFAIGSTVHPALEAAGMLQQEGISCAVVNARFIKPLDVDMLKTFAGSVKVLVTVEENALQGGFGSAVIEALQEQECVARVCRIGIPDRFVEQGSQKQLRAKYNLDAHGIAATVKRTLADGRP
jgi:1-deoxy-D-xylulose-5-phosphate synthase